MNVLDLFSGIGGFSLGLERAGMRTVAFCEIEPYCQAVLRKHWPGVPVFGDVRLLTRDVLVSQGIEPEVICGGFPCQDISLAGKGAGLGGERSGLWSEFHRLIDEIRPRYAIIENVSALRSRGLDSVLGALAAIGYDAEWHCIPACAVGAPHRRDRIWIVAYTKSDRGDGPIFSGEREGVPRLVGSGEAVSYPHGERQQERQERHGGSIGPGLEAPCRDDAVRLRDVVPDPFCDELRIEPGGRGGQDRAGAALVAEHGEEWDVADAGQELRGARQHAQYGDCQAKRDETAGELKRRGSALADAGGSRLAQRLREEIECGAVRHEGDAAAAGGWWDAEPDVGRVANGVPSRVDRLRALGNAVVPQIPEIIGRAIMSVNRQAATWKFDADRQATACRDARESGDICG